MSLPMLMGSYSTKHLLKIITGVVLVIGDPWVDRIESRCARRRAGGALRCQLAWVVAPGVLDMPIPLLWRQEQPLLRTPACSS